MRIGIRARVFFFGSLWSLFTFGYAILLSISVLRLSRKLCYFFFPFPFYVFVPLSLLKHKRKYLDSNNRSRVRNGLGKTPKFDQGTYNPSLGPIQNVLLEILNFGPPVACWLLVAGCWLLVACCLLLIPSPARSIQLM